MVQSKKLDSSLTVTDPAIKQIIAYIEDGKYNSAMKWIQNKKAEEEQVLSRTEVFDAYPQDGANAFTEVLKTVYGWIEQKPIPATWFSSEQPSSEQPPVMLVVERAEGRTEVPWGTVAVPNIDGTMNLHSVNQQGVWKFAIKADVKKKHMAAVKNLMELTRQYVRDHSIYRGQTLRLEWNEEAGNAFTPAEAGFATPAFMLPTGLTEKDIVLSEPIYDAVEATIFSLIENAADAKRMKIPTKRLALLAGEYGTGKTLCAAITAEICRKHARTFIYLADVRYLAEAIHSFGEQYAPLCIYGEDIDAVKDLATIDRISNTIDGVDTKGLDALFILTTNHVDQIPKKFLRSGRSDMIIKFRPPDATAAAALIIKYGGITLDANFTSDDAFRVGKILADTEMIPASIREVVERSKLFALAKHRKTITRVDLERAAVGVIDQCELLKETRKDGLPEHIEAIGTMVRVKNGKHTLSVAGE